MVFIAFDGVYVGLESSIVVYDVKCVVHVCFVGFRWLAYKRVVFQWTQGSLASSNITCYCNLFPLVQHIHQSSQERFVDVVRQIVRVPHAKITPLEKALL